METIADRIAPMELKLALSEARLNQLINAHIPRNINQEKLALEVLGDVKVSLLKDQILTETILKIRAPIKYLGAIKGIAIVQISFANLADLENIKVNESAINWTEGPEFELNKNFSFSIKKLAGSRLKQFEKDLGPMIEKAIPQQLKGFIEDYQTYAPYLQQVLPEQNLKLQVQIERIFYQSLSLDKQIEISLFPVLTLNVIPDEMKIDSAKAELIPGVGGGLAQFNLSLTKKQINLFLAAQAKGKRFTFQNRTATVKEITTEITSSGISVKGTFEEKELPEVIGLLNPELDLNGQVVSIDIKELKVEKAAWFWKGLFGLLKNNIEHRLEEKMKFDIDALLNSNIKLMVKKIDPILAAQGFIFDEFKPEMVIEEIIIIDEHLVVKGFLGGQVSIAEDPSFSLTS